jgi:phosphoenolpyruvate synthase/pyruvate phosphate dikinase
MHVLWFRDCTKKLLPKVGAKNAILGEMSKGGIPVPHGIDVIQTLHQVDIQDVTSAENASQTIRQLIESALVL